jgi:hypothetical protein
MAAMAARLVAAVLAVLVAVAVGLPNGLGRLPAMGWNSWYDYMCDNWGETDIKATMDAMAASGCGGWRCTQREREREEV